MRSRPPSGDGFDSGVLSADRCDILIDSCWPARRKSGLFCATAFNQALVASLRSRVDAFVTPNSTPWVNAVCPFSWPYPFCGTALIELFDDRLVQLLGTDA